MAGIETRVIDGKGWVRRTEFESLDKENLNLQKRIGELTEMNSGLEAEIIALKDENEKLKKRIEKEFHNEKKIIAVAESGETLEFPSQHAASEALGIPQPTISQCIKNGNQTRGYFFDLAM